MSHRLLVESIETDFVPALVYNNKKQDAEKLKQFNEPSWNNPVIRFFDSDWNDVIARQENVWDIGPVTNRMIAALKKANSKNPNYVVPIHLELTALQYSKNTEHASFAMHCYWEGEIQFGAVDGVKQTQSAWYDGKEIVNVTFDPTIISYTSIVETALKVRCASTVYTRSASQKIIAIKLARDQAEPIAEKEFGRPAIRSDQKYYLRNSPLRLLPLTAVQETRVNSALGRREKPTPYLTVTQYEMLKAIQTKLPNNRDLAKRLATAKAKMDFNSYFDFAKKNLISSDGK
jgi:hypothetical protein